MKRFLAAAVAVLMLLLVENPLCAQSGIKINSYKIAGISPTSLRSLGGKIQFNCTNSGNPVSFRNISGTVYKNGKAFLTGTVVPFSIQKGTSTFVISGNAALCAGVSFMDVLSCLSFNLDDYTADISMNVVSQGKSVPFVRKNVRISSLLHR